MKIPSDLYHERYFQIPWKMVKISWKIFSNSMCKTYDTLFLVAIQRKQQFSFTGEHTNQSMSGYKLDDVIFQRLFGI